MSFAEFMEKEPSLAKSVFVAGNAEVMGDVKIGEDSSIWFQSIVRGDVNYIRIGERTNLQDFCMVHVATDGSPTIVGDDVTVGHRATLHACTVENLCLIGMGAILMDGSHIGEESIVAAGSLVPPNKKFPPRSLILGNPAKKIRDLNEKELAFLRASSKRYVDLARKYLEKNSR